MKTAMGDADGIARCLARGLPGYASSSGVASKSKLRLLSDGPIGLDIDTVPAARVLRTKAALG